MKWSDIGLSSRMAMQTFPGPSLPTTPAGRVECAMGWLLGVPIVDEFGNDTGERSGPLITKEQARRMLESA